MNEDRHRGAGGARRGDEESADELRVTDRRRFNSDGDKVAGAEESESTDRRPSEVDQHKAARLAAEQKLLEMQQRFDELRAQLQRETDATRQRLNRAADERAAHEKGEFVSGLLPVIDNLYRAIDASDSGSFDSLLDGVRTTASGFEKALQAAGVEPIESVGAQFNPEFHEAVDTVEVEPELDGVVTAEHSRGYKMGDRLLRPARVQVGRVANSAQQHAGV